MRRYGWCPVPVSSPVPVGGWAVRHLSGTGWDAREGRGIPMRMAEMEQLRARGMASREDSRMMAREFALGVLVLAGSAVFGVEPGLPAGFDLSWRPMGANTGKLVEEVEAVYEDGEGNVRCQYIRGVDLPAVREYGDWVCPAVTLWHIREVDIERFGGKCGGLLCMYDYTMPGDLPTATTVKRVAWCPDVVVTRREGGYLRIRGGLRFGRGDRPEPYYNSGVIPMSFPLDPELAECGGENYREQLRFWLEEFSAPGYGVREEAGETDSWDGT